MTYRHTVGAMPKRNDPDELLTSAQVAAMWNVSVRTVQRYVADGNIKGVRLPGGRGTRIRRADADAALQAVTA